MSGHPKTGPPTSDNVRYVRLNIKNTGFSGVKYCPAEVLMSDGGETQASIGQRCFWRKPNAFVALSVSFEVAHFRLGGPTYPMPVA